MEKMIKYFAENPSEFKAILDGKASFIEKLSNEQTLYVIKEVLDGVVTPMVSFWG